MPAESSRAERDFGAGLLHLVFAKQRQPEGGRGAHRFGWVRLGDGKQGDGIRLAAGALTRGANPLLNRIEVFSQTHGGIVNLKSSIVNSFH